jgi:hypothetical protein
MEPCVGAHHLNRKLQMLGPDARLMTAQAQKLAPRRHWRRLSNQDPSPRTTLVQERVKLRPADSDGTTIGQQCRPARRFDGGHKVAFRCQISFNQGCDIVHDPTSGSGRLDSQRDKEIAGCGRFPKSDQLIELPPSPPAPVLRRCGRFRRRNPSDVLSYVPFPGTEWTFDRPPG